MVSEKNRALLEFFAVFEIVNIGLSVVGNLLLIYLIVYRSSKEIGAYRYLLIAFAMNDICFPVLHFLTLPVICTYKDAFVLFAHGFLTSKLSICFFGSCFSQTMPLLCNLFVYRLIATKWPRHLQFYTAANTLLLLVITLGGVSSIWFANMYISYSTDAETREYVQPFFDAEFRGERIDFIGALFYSTNGAFRLSIFFATMGFNTIMATCFSIIVCCSIAIVNHLRSKDMALSGTTKRLQQQMFHTLLIQAKILPYLLSMRKMIIPMIFVYSPCAGIINTPMLGFHVNVFPNLVSASVTIFPILDALIVIFGIKSYRLSLLGLFKCIFTSTSSHLVAPTSTKEASIHPKKSVRI